MNQLPRELMPAYTRSRDVTAVLGPTNTGKTHYAIERMLAHGSGIIGLPLRLLAREVYEKVKARLGADAVALVTGEEKIKPDAPRFWVCTVEAMPRDIEVDFVAIDEVQLAGDLERGHVFTDRLLHHRGRHETLLLGAGTVRGLVQQLLPGVHVVTRPRLSQLTYAGDKKITRLPPRSAVVAFSADEVYAIAELIRRQRGGAAVVLGALSPRTRNAQVALYQSGDVDFLVATDAVGMGLNLDVEHVAFAANRKFDGYQFRELTPGELGQIAGRAGRHMRDGTFGVTGRVDPFPPDLVERLEGHEFDPLKVLQWRNPILDFRSIDALRQSLDAVPKEQGLTRAPIGEDVAVLEIAASDPEIRQLAPRGHDVERLWEACQVPDYRKVSPASHADLCIDIFRFLVKRGKIPQDWFARHVREADRLDGDIDTLSTRIAHMRTWTFIANRPDWLDDPDHWREMTRKLEDQLSDALHERLTQRFVDRRTSVLLRRLRENAMLEAEINEAGDVTIEGQPVGRLQGFQFTPDATAEAQHGKALRAAAAKALGIAIANRAEKVAEAGNEAFILASNGGIRWMGEEIARLAAGEAELEPRVRLLADEQLAGNHREWVQARLDAWARQHVGTLLKPLLDLRTGTGLEGIARGIAFRLVEDLGVLERSKVADDVKGLDQSARSALRALGVRFGAYHLFVPATMKPKPRELAAQLWALKHGGLSPEVLQELPQLAQAGRTSIPVNKELPKAVYRVLGYRVLGERAVRVDILERLADIIRPLIAFKPGVTPGMPPKGAAEGDGFTVTVEMTSLVGCAGEDFASILKALSYRVEQKLVADHEKVIASARAKAEAEARSATAAAMTAVEGAAPGDASEIPGADTVATVAEQPQEAAPVEVVTNEAAIIAVEGAAPETPGADATPVAATAIEEVQAEASAPAVEPAEPAVVAPAGETVAAEPASQIAVVAADALVDVASAETVAPPETESAAADAMSEAASTETPAEPAPPATIEIWRPARFERRDHRGGERRPPRRGQPAAETRPAPGAPTGERPPGEFRRERGPREDRPRADRPGFDARPPRGDRPERGPRPDRFYPPRPQGERTEPPRAEEAVQRAPRVDNERPRGQRPPRHEGDRPSRQDAPRGPRPDRDRDRGDRAPRIFSSETDKNKGPDPDSPFAKLAALKAQLEENKKG